jgi:hypothetical protein
MRSPPRTAVFVQAALLISMAGCGTAVERKSAMPRDAELQRLFSSRASQLSELVAMSNQDSKIWRIAPDFARVEDAKAKPPRNASENDLPTERWNEYRRLFRACGLKLGLTRERTPAGEAVFFSVFTRTVGTVDSEEKRKDSHTCRANRRLSHHSTSSHSPPKNRTPSSGD